jgi:hypothetical protein
VLGQATPGQIGDAALSVLYWFRFVVRFVDDVVTGPNKYLNRLVDVTDSVLGGLIKGIYPVYLNLKACKAADEAVPPHAALRCNALDVTIVSRPVPRHDGGGIVMSASTEQYDKRREPCFKGLPVSRFGHVSSNVADSVHNSVVMSALCRHLVACGDLDNFVLGIARMVMDFRRSDYSARKVWRAVKRFVVYRAAWRFGETNAIYVFARIYHVFVFSQASHRLLGVSRCARISIGSGLTCAGSITLRCLVEGG